MKKFILIMFSLFLLIIFILIQCGSIWYQKTDRYYMDIFWSGYNLLSTLEKENYIKIQDYSSTKIKIRFNNKNNILLSYIKLNFKTREKTIIINKKYSKQEKKVEYITDDIMKVVVPEDEGEFTLELVIVNLDNNEKQIIKREGRLYIIPKGIKVNIIPSV